MTPRPIPFGDPALPPRFWTKAEVGADGCWNWLAGMTVSGYGTYTHEDRLWRAHRMSYTHLVGVIPTELDLDHLCRNRACVNPAHLEPVTRRENILRGILPQLIRNGDTCRNGLHPWPESAVGHLRPECGACKRQPRQCETCGKTIAMNNLNRHRRLHATRAVTS